MADDRPPADGAYEPGYPKEVVLNPSAAPRRTAPPAPPPNPDDAKDGFREIVETIVFVVVLVLLLKTFLAEAFVIPTGSMATTLLGYHRNVVCHQCGYPSLVNASPETEDGVPIVSCHCPNCGARNNPRGGPAGGLP